MPASIVRVVLLVLLFNGCALAAPTGNVTRLADGFAWLENLWFDGQGGLYASDFYNGSLWKWTRDPVTRATTQTLWVSGWYRIYGISASPYPDTVLVVAVYNATSSGISVVSTLRPQNHTRLAWTPTSGNGLAYNNVTGWVYTCNEGLFIPNWGKTMSVNAFTATPDTTAEIFQDSMTAADGTFVDVEDQRLYLTSSTEAQILVYDVSSATTAGTSTKTFLTKYRAPGCWTLDDIGVSHDLPWGWRSKSDRTPFIFAADFIAGAVRMFNASGEGSATTWASGFHALTSARQGSGPGWGDVNSIYVTEGGTFNPADTNRGLWEVHLQRGPY